MFESSLTNDSFLQFLSKQVEAPKIQRFLPVLLPAWSSLGCPGEAQQPPGLSTAQGLLLAVASCPCSGDRSSGVML